MGKKANHSSSGKAETVRIEKQVLSSTPVLEAFGNAKTLRNDNSSRFGKFIEIQFGNDATIVGANIRTYLLEKSRLVHQARNERNYHIFYQLLAGLSLADRDELSLSTSSVSDFRYLNQSGCISIDNVDDRHMFITTSDALTTLGIKPEEQKSISRVLAAILHLGNVTFVDNNDSAGSSRIVDDKPLNTACKLLQIDPKAISRTLLTRNISVGKEQYVANLTAENAANSRDALSMLIYSRLFDWLVYRINENISNPSKTKYTIGILDIYGFESFETNSFEQFCINWANEKLQQQYNQHIFKLEQQEYVREKISWSMLEFNDNQGCLDLIEKGQLCILSILDEECRFPKANAQTLAEKLVKNQTGNPYFEKPRFGNTGFTIRHYADKVTYDTSTFLEKNRDYIIPDQITIIQQSTLPIIQVLFKVDKSQQQQQQGEKKPTGIAALLAKKPSSNSSTTTASSFQFTSVSSQFKDSLAQLMDTISLTYVHFIRCIKPNQLKVLFIYLYVSSCSSLAPSINKHSLLFYIETG